MTNSVGRLGLGVSSSITLGVGVMLVLWGIDAWSGAESLRIVSVVMALPLTTLGLLNLHALFHASLDAKTPTMSQLDLSSPNLQEAQAPELRFIPVSTPRLAQGPTAAEIRFFVRQICGSGDFTQRSWRGVELPSGRKCDDDLHRRMVAVLEKAGFIAGRGNRVSGELTTQDAGEILLRLGLAG